MSASPAPVAKVTNAYEEMRAFLAQGRIVIRQGQYQPAPEIVGRAVCCLAKHRRKTKNAPVGAFVFAGYTFEWHLQVKSDAQTIVLEIVADVLHRV